MQLPIRARGSTGWAGGEANYDDGLKVHKHSRPAPKWSAPLAGLGSRCVHLVPGPVSFTVARPRDLPASTLLPHHARYDVAVGLKQYAGASGSGPYGNFISWNNTNPSVVPFWSINPATSSGTADIVYEFYNCGSLATCQAAIGGTGHVVGVY
jgi:hypothetical protein